MTNKWENFFSQWAKARGVCPTEAGIRLDGTPLCVDARERFLGGAAEKVVCALLDYALDSSLPIA